MIRIVVLFVLITSLLFGGSAYAQSGPGVGLFAYKCSGDGITFLINGYPALTVRFDDIALPLAVALIAQENQFISSAGDVSVWALKSNELQVHLTARPDETKMVISSAACGPINVSPELYERAATAVAHANPLTQRAYATTSGDALAAARAGLAGGGIPLAAADALVGAPQPSQAPPGYQVHVVQQGENLFRIALRYHTTVDQLARLNGLADPRRIYIGQVLIVP